MRTNLLVLLAFCAGCSHSYLSETALSSTGVVFSPQGGPVAGGNSLTFSGADFNRGATVTLGGVDCPVSNITGDSIVCTVPASVTGWARVVISSPGQTTVSLAQTYAYGASVIGQPTFLASSLNYVNSLSQPAFALPAGSQLFVADSQANRITVYAPAPVASSGTPTTVLGRSTTGSTLPYTNSTAYAQTMGTPKSMCSYGTSTLLAVDSARNRVLVYSPLPSGPSSTPKFVLGQVDFVGEQANRGSAAIDGTMLSAPSGIFCDGSRILSRTRAIIAF